MRGSDAGTNVLLLRRHMNLQRRAERFPSCFLRYACQIQPRWHIPERPQSLPRAGAVSLTRTTIDACYKSPETQGIGVGCPDQYGLPLPHSDAGPLCVKSPNFNPRAFTATTGSAP